MDKINVEIENCYGISKFVSGFDFTGNQSTHLIYAPNGVMKTSFANVFDDFSKDVESKDLIYANRIPLRRITNNDGSELERASVFVIKPYEKSYKSDKTSSLLVNEELRDKYSEIYKKIDVEKDKLIQQLRKNSGIKNNIEGQLSKTFIGDEKSFFVALEALEGKIIDEEVPLFNHISYSKIFDDKVVSFLETGEIKKQIKKYIEKYDELLKSSTFLKKGFNHYNASTIHKHLKDNGFFTAEHTVNLKMDGKKTEVANDVELSKIIDAEKERIINDKDLKSIFDSIDNKITTAPLREFREYLFENKDVLIELADLETFRKKLWISYLKYSKDLYLALMAEYKKGQIQIREIIKRAKNEETDWEKVIDIFNRRFFVPYRLKMKNKEDTILKDYVPSIHYYFQDREENVEEEHLVRVLSQGKKERFICWRLFLKLNREKNRT